MGGLLEGTRVVEVALLAPDAVGMHLADLGADVIKVEPPPPGDYVRQVGATMVDGVSALHRRWNRGKRSVALDLHRPSGAGAFLDLVRRSDAVVEGLRPGSLARRGLGYEVLSKVRPGLVMLSLSGFGQTGPYRDLASHGVAYDAYAGLAPVTAGPDGHPAIARHTQVGMLAGPLYAAMALVAGVLRARTGGEGCWIDVSEADAATAWNASEIEREEVGGRSPAAERRPGPTLADSVRYQYYRTADGEHVLLMASEKKFWQRFCDAVGRRDLVERFPGADVGEHAPGNLELRRELAAIFITRTRGEWIELFLEADVPGSPVHDARTLRHDPHFRARMTWLDPDVHGMGLVGSPVRVEDVEVDLRAAPPLGRDTREVLQEVLGYDDAKVEQLASDKSAFFASPGPSPGSPGPSPGSPGPSAGRPGREERSR